MVSVTSASHYQSRSSMMYIRGLIPGNSTELADAIPIALATHRVLITDSDQNVRMCRLI